MLIKAEVIAVWHHSPHFFGTRCNGDYHGLSGSLAIPSVIIFLKSASAIFI